MSAPTASPFASWLASPPPPAAIEISSRRVSAVAVSRRGASAVITGQSSEPLAAGVVTPVLNGVNVHDARALAAAIKAAVERVSPRPRRAALVLPDTVAKVSILRFEKIPAKAQDLEQLIRWQMRKAAPFRVEDAQVSWTEGVALPDGGREYLVVVARRDIVESYEQACEAAGVHAGLVDIVSTNLVNAVLATRADAASGDWLLVHVAPEYSTLAVVRNGQVIFFRNRPSEGLTQEMGDLVHQTAMYYEDRLGGASFTRVVLAGASTLGGDAGERARRQIEERLGARVEPIDVREGITLRDRISAGPDLLDTLAPAAGALLRDRTTAPRGGERVA
ncbi:MAG TPA: pilus assembly protein PilM [Vicinamibacterales bacterium]|nr:pilus assembly protein PilM [Vicinamibacterales bacterium]